MTATATKPDLSEVLDAYLAAWNTDDAMERARLLEKSVTDDVEFIDPMANFKGTPDLAQHITAVRSTYHGVTFASAGELDAHNNVARAPWVARTGDTELHGLDVYDIAEDGRLRRIVGFFDRDGE